LRIRIISIVLVSIIFLALVACKAKKERVELIEFGKKTEVARQQSEGILMKFHQLKRYEDMKNFQELAQEMAQLILEIDDMLKPIKESRFESEEIVKLQKEYIVVWSNFQDIMRMVLEVMVTGNKELGASLQQRLAEKNTMFQTALQQFNTHYDILMRRHGLSGDDLDLPFPEPTVAP